MRKQIMPVVIGAIVHNGKFLMTKRVHLDPEDYEVYHNAWQLPGGGIEFGETPLETLHREIKEEVGNDVEVIKLLPKVYSNIRKNWQGILIVYLCQLKNPQAKIVLDDEASDYGWFTLEEAKKLKTLGRTTEILEDVLKISAGGES